MTGAEYDSRMQVVIVAPEEAEILDIAGPAEIFRSASGAYESLHDATPGPYSVKVISSTNALMIRTSSGLELKADETFRSFSGAVDTLLVAGGLFNGIMKTCANRDLLHWLVAVSKNARRVGSICTGAFVLAAAGLLRGRRATTHWSRCSDLARMYADICVEPDAIYTVDGSIYTSAGVTAGMDLALALVEADVGVAIAAQVAKDMVLYLRRPGGQAQLSTTLELQAADRKTIRDMQSWIVENIRRDLSIHALAGRAAMSPRHFGRVFSREIGTTPARFVERVRVETAVRRLEESDDTIDQIAMQCGFGSADSMRRSFVRAFRATPSELRGKIRARGAV
jgi:transcriptional regulator GlxA family with amidase domain